MDWRRYIYQMQNLRDRLVDQSAIATGLPNSRSLIIRHRRYEDGVTSYEHTIIQPYPIIVRASPRLEALPEIGRFNLVTGEWMVKGISRNYSRNIFTTAGAEFFVEAEYTQSGVEGGFKCEFVDIEEQTLTYNLRLKEKIGEQKVYP